MFSAGIYLGTDHADFTPGIRYLIVAGKLEDSLPSKFSAINACDVVLVYQREDANNFSDMLAQSGGFEPALLRYDHVKSAPRERKSGAHGLPAVSHASLSDGTARTP